MPSRPPLSTLLSQALVAFTIEFDNEAEHRLPHTTTDFGRTPGALPAPWLASMAMWFNCMQHIDDDRSVTVSEMGRLARTKTNLNGMQRWGYIFLEPDPADPRRKPPLKDWLVLATPAGRVARAIWQPLFAEIETRWRYRFGTVVIDELRNALTAIAAQLDANLPDCMPIIGYGLFSSDPNQSKGHRQKGRASQSEGAPPSAARGSDLPLPALLARLLVAFAIEFEQGSPVSMALGANVLRVLSEAPNRLRELPERTGISTEYLAVATGWLARHGYAVLSTAPAPDRGKQIRLNEKGLLAQENSRKRAAAIEKQWQQRFGTESISKLRAALEPLVKDGTSENSPLFAGLIPYPEGWRAKVRSPRLLPHFPMVTHRGGYPDGS